MTCPSTASRCAATASACPPRARKRARSTAAVAATGSASRLNRTRVVPRRLPADRRVRRRQVLAERERPSAAPTIAASAATGAAVPARRPRDAPVTARRSAGTAPATPASRVRRVPPTATSAATVRAPRVKREAVRRIVPCAGTAPAGRSRTGRPVRRIAAPRRVAATASAPWAKAPTNCPSDCIHGRFCGDGVCSDGRTPRIAPPIAAR